MDDIEDSQEIEIPKPIIQKEVDDLISLDTYIGEMISLGKS